MLTGQALSHICGLGVSRENAIYILTKVLNKEKVFIYTDPGYELDREQVDDLNHILHEHIDNLKPLAYIFREVYFCGEIFKSDDRALIPRVETELLVDEAAAIISDTASSVVSILDLCTGSGIIPVTLAGLFPDAAVFASDISCDALELAQHNADIHNQKITFVESDLFDNIPDTRFDLITANPPYIGISEQDTIDESVLRHEPHLALFGGGDGMYFIDRILSRAHDFLKPGGHIVMEINSNQGEKVLGTARKYGYDGRIRKDLADMDRLLVARI